MARGNSAAAAAVLAAVLTLVTAQTPPTMDEEMAELVAMIRDSCVDETGVDASLIDKVNEGVDMSSMTDAKLKCYVKCIMETAGMMTDGEVDVEAVLAMMPDDLRHKTEAAVRSCGSKHGADHCDNAYLTQACWQQTNKADYFLV